MAESYEMNPTARLAIGTLGEPGNRTFYLQGINGLESLAVIIEKQQAYALADAIDEMLNDLEERFELPPPRPSRISSRDFDLQLPVDPSFRVAQMGLGYDEDHDMVLIAVQELTQEELFQPSIIRYWINRDQAAALSRHARQIVASGRPTCALCGKPITPGKACCPRVNGHLH